MNRSMRMVVLLFSSLVVTGLCHGKIEEGIGKHAKRIREKLKDPLLRLLATSEFATKEDLQRRYNDVKEAIESYGKEMREIKTGKESSSKAMVKPIKIPDPRPSVGKTPPKPMMRKPIKLPAKKVEAEEDEDEESNEDDEGEDEEEEAPTLPKPAIRRPVTKRPVPAKSAISSAARKLPIRKAPIKRPVPAKASPGRPTVKSPINRPAVTGSIQPSPKGLGGQAPGKIALKLPEPKKKLPLRRPPVKRPLPGNPASKALPGRPASQARPGGNRPATAGPGAIKFRKPVTRPVGMPGAK